MFVLFLLRLLRAAARLLEPLAQRAGGPGSIESANPGQRIGVYDYKSLVGLLADTYQAAFPGSPATDPQNMIQLLGFEILRLRRLQTPSEGETEHEKATTGGGRDDGGGLGSTAGT